ncbi:MAG TPA: methyltransferase domain-containing protein [Actinopolymorphaceae bacterium]
MAEFDLTSLTATPTTWEESGQVHATWLAQQARGDVLDVGCGEGTTSILCARRGCKTLGVDIDSGCIERARSRREREPESVRTLLTFRHGDMRSLDLPAASFDSVLLGEVLEEYDRDAPAESLTSARSVLAEAVRVLRDDGVLALTTPVGYVADDAHRSTFYLMSLLDLLGEHLAVAQLSVVHGFFHVTARPGRMTVDDRLRLIADVQADVEAALLEAQRAAHHRLAFVSRQLAKTEERLSTVNELNSRLASTEERLREQTYQLRYARWQLESLRSGRWWRLGQVITEARRQPRSVVRLPRNVARALRRMPRPEPPVRQPAARGALAGGPDASGHYCTIDLPKAVELPDGPIARPGLTVAVILDVFSATAFSYEWHQVQFGPDDWREVLQREKPDLLFVESAWWGNGGRWKYQMTAPTAPKQELRDLVAWCRRNNIPTVFWNKEDPPHFDRFLETAKLFDYVFTVDSDCIPRYREALGHDRIGLLPFAAQPRIHNPISVAGGRRYNVAFAGTYYTDRHPERIVQMETVVAPAREFGLHIFNRMSDDPKFRYPEEYAPHIVGSLPYERMLAAYKAYKLFLNVNSVTESPTMCARRVFELSACSTPVLSGHSRALEAVFGDLVRLSTSREESIAHLTELLENDDLRERLGHQAMREVLTKHTFGHRVDSVLQALGLASRREPPSVSVILPTNRPEQLTHAIEQVAIQRHRPLQLVLVLHGIDLDPKVVRDKARAAGIQDVVVRTADRELTLGACLNLGIEAADGEYLAKMDDDNIYGEYYLTDMLLPFSYTRAGIVGKGAHYVYLQSSKTTILRFAWLEHSYASLVQGGSIVATRDVLRELRFADRTGGEDTDLLRRARAERILIYSPDRFNFVSVRRSDPSSHTWDVSDDEVMRNSQVAFEGSPEEHVLF